MVCYIEDNHIMPGVWADCPSGLMSYAQFERFWVPYTLNYPDHVKITHLGTVLDTKFQFGNGPSGILVGGESNTGTWDEVMLGGLTWKRESGCKGDILRGTAPEQFTSSDGLLINLYSREPAHDSATQVEEVEVETASEAEAEAEAEGLLEVAAEAEAKAEALLEAADEEE